MGPGLRESRGAHGIELGDELGLYAVGERHPDEISKRQHEAKALTGDVHRGEDAALVPERVEDIQQLEPVDHQHWKGDLHVIRGLLRARAGSQLNCSAGHAAAALGHCPSGDRCMHH